MYLAYVKVLYMYVRIDRIAVKVMKRLNGNATRVSEKILYIDS